MQASSPATTPPLQFSRLEEDKEEESRIKLPLAPADTDIKLPLTAADTDSRVAAIQTAIGAPTVLFLLLTWLQNTEAPPLRRMLICAIPSVMMLFMSLVAYRLTVPTDVMSAFQHLAAGLLISAVSVELTPPLLEAPSDLFTMLAIVGGFAAGIGILTLLSTCCEAEDDEDDESGQDAL